MFEKSKWSTKNFFSSFKFACSGLWYTICTQRNIKIQLVFALLAISLGIFFKITKLEWGILIFTIMFVIFAEMINTSIESAVDLFTDEYNEKAKIVKDVAAGAVLLTSINAVIIGFIIFFDRIVHLIF